MTFFSTKFLCFLFFWGGWGGVNYLVGATSSNISTFLPKSKYIYIINTVHLYIYIYTIYIYIQMYMVFADICTNIDANAHTRLLIASTKKTSKPYT